jgi:hypothetical protein
VHCCCCCYCHFCNTYLVHTSRLCLPGCLPCLRTRLLKLALTGLDPCTTYYFTRFLLLQSQKWCASGSLLDTQETLLQEQHTDRQKRESWDRQTDNRDTATAVVNWWSSHCSPLLWWFVSQNWLIRTCLLLKSNRIIRSSLLFLQIDVHRVLLTEKQTYRDIYRDIQSERGQRSLETGEFESMAVQICGDFSKNWLMVLASAGTVSGTFGSKNNRVDLIRKFGL